MERELTRDRLNKLIESLLLCPYCGSVPSLRLFRGGIWKVSCDRGCLLVPDKPNCGFRSIEVAVRKWNERVVKRDLPGPDAAKKWRSSSVK